MATAAQRLAELERRVAELANEVKSLREQAIALGILNEMREMRAEARQPPGAPSHHPRHLHAVGPGGGR